MAVFKKVEDSEIEEYVDEVSEDPLVMIQPVGGRVENESTIDTIGVTVWKLSNGIKVILKPTDFKNDEILFTYFSPGGNSLAADENYLSAITAANIIQQGGIGTLSRIELQKKLTGKVVRVSPFISSLIEGINGGASPKDIETMFELIYLYFTAPRKDTTAFKSYFTRMKGIIENRSAQPESAFSDTLQVTLAQYHFRSRPLTMEMLDEMNLDSSFAFYRERFRDSDDFTFVFVGNFDLDTIKPLVEKYLGSLASHPGNEQWRDVGIKQPEGVIKKTIRKGIEQKCRVQLVFSGDYMWERQNNYDLESMIAVMQIRLREKLREDESGTYGVGVSSSKSRYPNEEYSINISFGCAPDRVEELTGMIFTEIDSLQQFGPGETYISKVKEAQTRRYETNLKENRFWLGALYNSFFYERDPGDIINYTLLVDGLTVQAVQDAASKYFKIDNYVKVVLLPEE